jgi:DNA-binding transcriptional ArsR family regulator
MSTPEAILAQSDWNPLTFKAALADLRRVEENDTTPDLEQRVTSVLRALATHLTNLRLLGRTSVMRGYAEMLGELLMRHPALPRLRNLTFAQRVGARLELMVEDLMQAEALPTVDIAKAALTAPRAEARLKLVQALVSSNSWTPTSRLADVSGTTKQNVHLVLPVLRGLGLLVTREEKGQHLHRATELAKRVIESIERDQIRRAQSLHNKVMTKYDVGIDTQANVMQRALRLANA